jgi:hypothetical protein
MLRPVDQPQRPPTGLSAPAFHQTALRLAEPARIGQRRSATEDRRGLMSRLRRARRSVDVVGAGHSTVSVCLRASTSAPVDQDPNGLAMFAKVPGQSVAVNIVALAVGRPRGDVRGRASSGRRAGSSASVSPVRTASLRRQRCHRDAERHGNLAGTDASPEASFSSF